MPSFARILVAAFALAAFSSLAYAGDHGVVRVKSSDSVADTVERLKQDIAAKGILFFSEIDQAGLAAMAGVRLRPSTLLVFGNPALGTLFITANAEAGLDWPVRLLVTQDETGEVWAVYTDFEWIAARHGIRDREAELATASRVISSITESVSRK